MSETQNKTTPPFSINLPFEYRVLQIDGLKNPFIFRPIYADIFVIRSIFGFEEYELPPIKDFQPKLILDCGGNIGCAALYFAIKYPAAQIYSVEPEKNNFSLLQYNTFLYKNIHAINSALWDKVAFVGVEKDDGLNELAFNVFETTADNPNALRTITVSKLLAASGFDEIDLLKIDIEGAEKEVFAAPDVDKWLSKVKVLVIELHDRMKLGCSYEFFKAVSKYRWFFAFRGENLIFIRESLMT